MKKITKIPLLRISNKLVFSHLHLRNTSCGQSAMGNQLLVKSHTFYNYFTKNSKKIEIIIKGRKQ